MLARPQAVQDAAVNALPARLCAGQQSVELPISPDGKMQAPLTLKQVCKRDAIGLYQAAVTRSHDSAGHCCLDEVIHAVEPCLCNHLLQLSRRGAVVAGHKAAAQKKHNKTQVMGWSCC